MTSSRTSSTLHDPRVAQALSRMFAQAQLDDAAYERALARRPQGFDETSFQERADAMEISCRL